MGRPVKKSKLAQFFIVTSSGSEEIIEQTGTRKYKTALAGDVFLTNKIIGYLPGEAGVACQPFGIGDAEIVSKITQHRCTTYAGNTYTWVPKGTGTIAGEAELNPVASAPIAATNKPEPKSAPKVDYTPEAEVKSEPKYCPEVKLDSKAPGTYMEDVVRKPKLSSNKKTKSKEKSKPIEDLLNDLDKTDIEV